MDTTPQPLPSTSTPQLGRPLVIRPSRPLLKIDWAEIWHYRDLLMLLVKRDFSSKYRQTILGPLWFLLQPLLTTCVFSVVFGQIARISTGGVPAILFYLNGLIGWNYLAQTFTMGATTFTTHADMFQKVYFPRLVVPLSILISNIFSLLVQLGLFLGFYVYFFATGTEGLPLPNITWGLFPLFVLHLGLLGLGCALWSSALTARYRDLSYLVPVLVQLWMYGTPIIYPLSAVPAAYHDWITLNPATAPIEGIRHIFLSAGVIDYNLYMRSIGITGIILLTGLILFKRAEIHSTDTA